MQRIMDFLLKIIPEEHRELVKPSNYFLLGLVALSFVAIILLQSFNSNNNLSEVKISDLNPGKNNQRISPNGANVEKKHLDNDKNPNNQNKLFVHVAGHVSKPGVYEVKEGDRVYDVVLLAGLLENSCTDALNLAMKVSDGEKVYVPSKEEMEKVGWPGNDISQIPIEGEKGLFGSNTEGMKVNLNKCDAEDLEKLPGIGEKTAQKILDYRKRNGNFKSVEELLEVQGIGEKKLESIRAHVYISK